jgi:hypothetical protein
MNVADRHVSNAHSTPPRAPLAFRVGVVGHRPDRLDNSKLDELAATIRTILSTVKGETLAVAEQLTELYDGARPLLRAMSPLAEGTDRILAEQAISLGFELCAVLPFPQSEFEKDFAQPHALEHESLNRFRGLLTKATTRFELDGTRAEEAAAYGRGGLVVLNQSDLLIVVWDGERQGKRGGTEDTFSEGRSRGVTVAWIDAKEPRNWQLLDAATPLPGVATGQRVAPDGSGSAVGLTKLVRKVLELPKLAEDAKKESHETKEPHDKRVDARTGLKLFYAERRPSWTLAVFWKLFVQTIGDGKWPKVRFRIDDFEAGVKEEWPADRSTPIAALVDRLRPYFAWPDKLAVLYADRYRSAFAINFLLAALAVGLALLPGALGLTDRGWPEIVCIALELVTIFAIIFLVQLGRTQHWNERWIDYRLTAELVRHLRMVAPLGGRRLLPQVPAHRVTYGQPAATWMAWYVRAVERWLGLPSAVVDKMYLDVYLKQLEHLVIEQISYHQSTLRRCHNMENRLHRRGIALLGLTVSTCALHLAFGFLPEHHRVHSLSPILTFICGFFPALGAALAAISSQGKFRSMTKQSRAMREQLRNRLPGIKSLRQAIVAAPDLSACTFSTEAEKVGSVAADLLVREVLDWRSVVLDQPMRTPA